MSNDAGEVIKIFVELIGALDLVLLVAMGLATRNADRKHFRGVLGLPAKLELSYSL